MKKHPLLIAAALLSFCSAAWGQSFEAAAVQWQKPENATLETAGNSLRVRFGARNFKPVQHGNWLYNQQTIPLLLEKPIPLTKNTERILFEAAGHEFKSWNTRNEMVQLWPLIRDENGEILAYIPQKFPHLFRGGSSWARWMSAPFFCGEAGGATQDIYTATGGDGNAWPDGKLEFIGFRLVINTAHPEKEKAGEIVLGNIELADGKIDESRPYFYADSVCKEAGDYQLAGSVSREFQGQPVGEFDVNVAYNPASPDSRRRKIELPIPPGNGHFWGEWAMTDATGKRVAGAAFRHQVTTAASECDAKPLKNDGPPALGFLRINPDRPGTYGPQEAVELKIVAYPRNAAKLKLRCEIMSYQYGETFETQDFELNFAGRSTIETLLRPRLLPGRDAYRLRATVSAPDGKVLQQAEYIFGRKSDLSQAYKTRIGKPVDRNTFKKHAYMRASFIVISTDKPKTEADLRKKFEHTLSQSGDLTRHWTYMIDTAEMEVLPGVFDFAPLDMIMDIANDYGIALTIRVGHIEQDKPYRWVRYSAQHNFDDLPIEEHFYGGYSLADNEYLELWHRLNRALFDRYGEHPAFEGFYLLQPAGEFSVEDKPWEGIVAGYEPPMRDAFRAYLRDELKLDLPMLNKRWGSAYKSWDEVLPPRPSFREGKQPDLRMSWFDFCRFKFQVDELGFFPEAVKRIRTYTDRHIVITYGGAKGGENDALTGKVDYLHNGGNHFLQYEEKFVNTWRKGKTGWINEPHHPQRWASYGDPAERGWVLDWTIYVALRQAEGGGANAHLYYDPRRPHLAALYGTDFAYDRFQKYKPILDELNAYVAAGTPAKIGVFQDKITMAAKHRTTFFQRKEDLKRFFELVKESAIPFVDILPQNIGQVDLIVLNPLDEVMTKENMDMIVNRVKNGARVVLSGRTGSFSPELGKEPWQLLKALGITPPQKPLQTTGLDVYAKITRPNPFFDTGSTLKFYTQTEFKRDLQSEEIKKEFWKFPYRWIPETDYFGYYPGHTPNGETIATFADGGAALSTHKVGQGEALVFWGCPDYRPERMRGFIERAAAWAKIENPYAGSPVKLVQEGKASNSGRRYALLYMETPGTYRQRLVTVPEGEFFAEELVGDRKLGRITGTRLREQGIELVFLPGASPLQILRFTPIAEFRTVKWLTKYPEL